MYAAARGSDLSPSSSHHLRLSPPRLAPTYVTLVGVPALALIVILRVGEALAPPSPSSSLTTAASDAGLTASTPVGVTQSPSGIPDLPLLLIQIIVVLLAARLVGALVRRLGQPQVVGEMLAGIALGPSLLGDVRT